ncbi:MAG: metallophosphoesterase [Nannocystis sp.]|nr:metallophosphoesterase [Nannocystis sp.]
MTYDPHPSLAPTYRGLQWIDGALPTELERWPRHRTRLQIDKTGDAYDIAHEELAAYAAGRMIEWPERPIYFLCDMHADTDAFFRSLVATGGVERTGPGDDDFKITAEGKRAIFVIGGDCIDKGPDNLRLLRALRRLIDRGADVELLTGNHDLRMLVGLIYGGARDPRHAHLFVRLGKKSIPLFREIFDHYIAGPADPSKGPFSGRRDFPSDAEVRAKLFHDDTWYDEFPRAVAGFIAPDKIEKEVARIREKTQELVDKCDELDMSLGMVYAAFEAARWLFLDPAGEFFWFFERMKLCRKYGSLLFIHAGVDDVIARLIRERGIHHLNDEFRRLLGDDLFGLYHGPFGNTFRTKYRPADRPFTEAGLKDMHDAGILAIVHGHRNILRGQRMVLRGGILNFECDVSVDCNTRALEGAPGPGGGATLIRPDGAMLGISTDHSFIKHFDVRTAFRLRRSRAGR